MGVLESERLARRYFAVFEQSDSERMRGLIHPEIEMTTRPGDLLRGADEIVAFLHETGRIYETYPEVYRPLDDDRIVVEGRVRWMDHHERILRDDPMVWALEFRQGLLVKSTPAQSVLEAEAILGAAI